MGVQYELPWFLSTGLHSPEVKEGRPQNAESARLHKRE